MRAAYSATVARRRKNHREPGAILASASTRTEPFGQVTVVNLSEGGAKLRTTVQDFVAGVLLSAGHDVGLKSPFLGTEEMFNIAGTVVWAMGDTGGVRFRYLPQTQKAALRNSSLSAWSGRFRGYASGSGQPARRRSLTTEEHGGK